MLEFQFSSFAQGTNTLASNIRPYQILYILKWENLLNKKQKNGWIQFFVQNYLTAKATEALLNFAAEQAAQRQDKALVPFIDWARIHAQEEKDHHEWYLDDLLALGFQKYQFENLIADEIILEMLGVQFSLIATAHPISILGYLFALECYNNEPENIYQLAQRFSIPAEGIRTFLYHAEVDQEHRKPIIELIDIYSPNDFFYRTILKSAIATLVGWTKFFTKLAQEG
jgi:hypothetical protein